METNNVVSVERGKSVFTIKRVLRGLAILLIVFTFCPAFLVSCSGQTINVTVFTAVGGVSSYGDKIVDPHPIMLICLILPIAMIAVLFIKKLLDTKVSIITLAAAVIDLIVWLIFKSQVKKVAMENYCNFKVTAIYVFNIIVLVLILLLTGTALVLKLSLDFDCIQFFSGNGMKIIINQTASGYGHTSGNMVQIDDRIPSIGFCQNCGSKIPYDTKFCIGCGTPVSEEVILAAEEAKKAEEARMAEESKKNEAVSLKKEDSNNLTQDIFCPNCGTKLVAGSVFCENCGTKVEQ